jgi:hypothetical protein
MAKGVRRQLGVAVGGEYFDLRERISGGVRPDQPVAAPEQQACEPQEGAAGQAYSGVKPYQRARAGGVQLQVDVSACLVGVSGLEGELPVPLRGNDANSIRLTTVGRFGQWAAQFEYFAGAQRNALRGQDRRKAVPDDRGARVDFTLALDQHVEHRLSLEAAS